TNVVPLKKYTQKNNCKYLCKINLQKMDDFTTIRK
ncbi:MAG: hypothetical protein RIR56_450, partial [Bacteroidota bacterium]